MTAPTLRELCEAAKRGDHVDATYDLGDWLGYPRDSREYVPEHVIDAILAALDAEATSIAYPRALQAAADMVLKVESHALNEAWNAGYAKGYDTGLDDGMNK